MEVDLHHKLLAGLPAHSLALRPAHSRRHPYVTRYNEGFSHFVTSTTAPVASVWSVRPVGLAATGKRRLLTARARSRPFQLRGRGRPDDTHCCPPLLYNDRGVAASTGRLNRMEGGKRDAFDTD